MEFQKCQVYLCKDVQKKNLNFCSTYRPIQVMYTGDKNGFKCFPNQSYDGEQLRGVINAIERRGESLKARAFISIRPYFLAHIHSGWQFDLIADVNFSKSLLHDLHVAVSSPKLIIKGTIKIVGYKWLGDSDWRLRICSERDFSVEDIPLREKGSYPVFQTTFNDNGRSSPLDAVLMDLKYSVILEWNRKRSHKLGTVDRKVNVLKELYMEKVMTDCVIVASNDKEINCHQCILAVHSDVLKTLLTSGLAESQTRRIELTDVTEECLNNLLAHMYERNMKFPEMTPTAAFELLQVAHKYNVGNLEMKLLELLCGKPSSYYTICNALSIHLFTVNVEGEKYKVIADKMLFIMKGNPQGLQESVTFQEFKTQFPGQAADLLMKVLLCGGGRKRKHDQVNVDTVEITDITVNRSTNYIQKAFKKV